MAEVLPELKIDLSKILHLRIHAGNTVRDLNVEQIKALDP